MSNCGRVPDVSIRWRAVLEGDEALTWSRCLYAMFDPRTNRILYIGKADMQTVGQRLRCRAKDGLWAYLTGRGIDACSVIVGELSLPQKRRLSSALLEDVESLLIAAEQPPGNVQCQMSRIDRPGLFVANHGRWPGQAKYYEDGAVAA